ncbi:hypothetical protein [Corynebacterium tapiri]|uniref:Secreted protein n=1 Tax=Corynebacterium tapiri TaxID=1448266 RepID=A0A5C4U288_9CORY|nr:hypothetical protein [Corynebacterium tapiri]TNL96604.1 hypothetical protein FHE74_07865 [Corynebacterium tapiri]
MRTLTRRAVIVACACAATAALSACSSDGAGTSGTESLTVSTSQTPTVEKKDTQDTDPIRPDKLFGSVKDPGNKVTFHFQGTNPGDYGGTEVTIAITNDNDAPLAPDALETPKLRYNSGGGSMTEAKLLEADVPEGQEPAQKPLRLPLGVGATTNLQYTFDVPRGNLWDAELQIGNVIYSGNLVA